MRPGIRRTLRAGVLLLIAILLLVGPATWLLLRGSVPRLDGESGLAGLAAPVSVSRDALGMVTIDARSEADAMRALGWVHAQERYFEMDLMRRVPAGELSALFGARALDVDRANRMHRVRARVEARLPTIATGREAPLQAYVAGVNAGRDALRVRPWPYLLLRQSPQPWTAADSVLTGYAMYFDLQDAGNARELALARLREELPPPLYALLTHAGSSWDAPLSGSVRGDAPLPDAGTVDLRALPAPPLDTPVAPPQRLIGSLREMRERAVGGSPAATDLMPGSNSFAVSGRLTADGRALVADDMHLGLRAPNIWFRVRLRYPDAAAPGGQVDVTGFTLPGLPAVIVGSTGHVAWGFTNSYGDFLDWQRVRPCATPGPATTAHCTAYIRHEERIAIAGGETVTVAVDETTWGPILHREDDGHALALRWVAHLPGSLDFGLAHFVRARNLDHLLQLANRAATPTQNLVAGDRHGAIAWRLLGPLPQRAAGCDGARISIASGPETGDTACAPWAIATNTSPMLRSPTADRLWTANNRIVDGEDFRRIGDGGATLGARAKQIRDALAASERFDEHDLLAIQLDDRALLMTRWWELLRTLAGHAGGGAGASAAPRDTATTTPALLALAEAADHWSGHADVESAAYRIVRAWRLAVHGRVADGLAAPALAALGDDFALPSLPHLEGVAWPLVTRRPAHLLPRRYSCATRAPADSDCDDARDGWAALFEDAAIEVRDELAAAGPLRERTWGERNTAAICHPLAGAIPLLGRRLLCMPTEPLPGDSMMPRVQGPGFGASQRMVVAPGHEADGIAHMPGGQSGHPLSPFWGAGHDDWVHGRASPFLPGETRHRLQLLPEGIRGD
ncbi:penicillin acylase family protein [Luteimonas yindakuii]|uniref:Penicillin acylase family protein n=1 Tax=Luteimonas yindakuii TaxID=2565782 RepID=A0A4Z1R5A9_9GAMM|nr:penicillin acylase family protein [Luteimonas yindakuii]TKS53725.1 penicillin acylase family protein [Luteimonas yindakuii]